MLNYLIKIFIIIFISLNLSQVSIYSQLSLSPMEKQWIKDNPNIYYAHSDNWMPYEGVDKKGNHIGISADLVKHISEQTNINLIAVHYKNWTQELNALQEGKVSFICSMIADPKKKFIDYSPSFYTSSFVIITQKSNNSITSLDKVNKNYKFSLPFNYYTYNYINSNYPEINIVPTLNLSEALKLVRTKQTDATVSMAEIGAYKIGILGYSDLKIVNELDIKAELCFGYAQHQNKILQGILNKSMNNLNEQKLIDKLKNKWITVEYNYGIDKASLYQYLFYIFLIFSSVSITFLFINKKLKAEIRDKNKAESELVLKNSKLKKLNEKISTKNKEIKNSILYAKNLQDSCLPNLKEFDNAFNQFFLIYKPKDIVSGDFYWLEELNNKIYFALADCTGHGVPGAIVSVLCNTALNTALYTQKIKDPAQILIYTTNYIVNMYKRNSKDIKDGMDIGLCCWDKNKKTLIFSGANHTLSLLRGNKLEIYKGNRMSVGDLYNTDPFTNHEINIEQNDTIYLTTDGFADQFGGENNKKFKSFNVKLLLMNSASDNLDKQKEIVEKSINNWMGENEQVDDISLMGIKLI